LWSKGCQTIVDKMTKYKRVETLEGFEIKKDFAIVAFASKQNIKTKKCC
jgi:hypothetical protein